MRPLYTTTPERQIAGLHRRMLRLERRGASPWVYVGSYPGDPGTTPNSPVWQNSHAQAAGRQLTRFRWALGGGLEMQISSSGGALLTIMFTLPAGYWDPTDGKLAFAAVDSGGGATAYTVVPNSTSADVYAGFV